jgi:hypothetical protein
MFDWHVISSFVFISLSWLSWSYFCEVSRKTHRTRLLSYQFSVKIMVILKF